MGGGRSGVKLRGTGNQGLRLGRKTGARARVRAHRAREPCNK